MEHDQRTCPSCGNPAGEHAFCRSCRSHMDALAGVPIRAAAQTAAAAAQANGENDPIGAPPASTAVQVEPDSHPAPEAGPTPGTIDLAKLPTSAPPRADVAGPARGVARLEDVLRVDNRDRIDARTSAGRLPTAEPAQDEATEAAEVPSDDILERAKRELERLEQLLRHPPTDFAGRIAAEAAAVVDPVLEPARNEVPQLRVSAPMYVAAHKLRAAFLYEQTAAFEQAAALEPELKEEPITSVPPPAPTPEATAVATELTSIAPPSSGHATPARGPETPPPGPKSQNHWLTAVCLLALIGLVVVLTGRRPCGCTQKTR